MRSLSDQFFLLIPALFALLLLGVFSAPAAFGGVSLVPNIAWVMTLIVAFIYPAAWPRWFAFLLGLLQDILFGTPLGSQALLTLVLVQLVDVHHGRSQTQQFRVRWLEAAGVLLAWHLLLWGLCYAVVPTPPPVRVMLGAGLVSALWYPFFYAPLRYLGHRIPTL